MNGPDSTLPRPRESIPQTVRARRDLIAPRPCFIITPVRPTPTTPCRDCSRARPLTPEYPTSMTPHSTALICSFPDMKTPFSTPRAAKTNLPQCATPNPAIQIRFPTQPSSSRPNTTPHHNRTIRCPVLYTTSFYKFAQNPYMTCRLISPSRFFNFFFNIYHNYFFRLLRLLN